MFCIKCGKEIEESASFCPFCGETLGNSSVASFVNETNDIASKRNQLVEELQLARPYGAVVEEKCKQSIELQSQQAIIRDISGYFSRINNVFRYINPFVIFKLSQEKAYKKEANKYLSPKEAKYGSISRWILNAIISLAVADIIFQVLIKLDYAVQSQVSPVFFTASLMLIIICWYIYTLIIVPKQEHSKLISALNQAANEKGKQANDLIDEANAELDRYIDNHNFIPEKYVYQHAVDYMLDSVVNGRADTLKEAINLFETYETQQQIIHEQDAKYQQLLEQQAFEKQYRADVKRNSIDDALMMIAIMFG